MSQIPFPFDHAPSLAAADFVIASCNEGAAAWVALWPDWPAPALTIHGPAESGKTHLGRIWAEQAQARAVPAAALADIDRIPELAEGRMALLVDDVDLELDADRERGLFHLYNLLAERRGHLMLLATQPPARWSLTLADLRSRLSAAPAVAIGAPDEGLLDAILAKLFTDRQLSVSPELRHYILMRIERSFAAAGAMVAALDRATLAAGRGVTPGLARSVLEELGRPSDGF
ncbi:HdaA/DnaA family protein [Hypericibacter sp.]|uniref:HdaA/DnaA family protein n=1 Tax=Hypericibacter sp. TaxID=2705401 RepID=UPI003D6C9B76